MKWYRNDIYNCINLTCGHVLGDILAIQVQLKVFPYFIIFKFPVPTRFWHAKSSLIRMIYSFIFFYLMNLTFLKRIMKYLVLILQYTLNSYLCPLHYTLHSALCSSTHFTLYTLHSALYSSAPFTLYTLHFIVLHPLHFTLCTL